MNVPAYISSVKAEYEPLADAITATDGFKDKMADIVSQFNIVASSRIDFTATDSTALYNNVIDVLNKLSSAGWDALTTTFPSLTDTIASTHENVSHLNTFLCYNIAETPWSIITSNISDHAYLMAFAGLLIPVISYLTQVLNIKLMPQTTASSAGGNEQADAMANQMKMMNNIMPLFSLVFCFTVPVSLGIYWITNAAVRAVQQVFLNKHFDKINLEDIIKKNQEKAKKKREKMGISENQIYNAARINTRKIENTANKQMTSAEKELQIEKANAVKASAKPGSMAAKANMVKDFNERNTRK
jgi:YidC/Oxa1 family membrane protein insertase